jgi:hypothetical protein
MNANATLAAPDYDKLNRELDAKMSADIDAVKTGIIKIQRQNARLIEALRDCLEYFQSEYDINNDGGPNTPMRLGQMVEEVLNLR